MMKDLEQTLYMELDILFNKKQTGSLTVDEENTLYLGTDFRGCILQIATDACTKGGHSGNSVQYVFSALLGLTLQKVRECELDPNSILRHCYEGVERLAKYEHLMEDAFKRIIEITVKICRSKPLSDLTYSDEEFYLADPAYFKNDQYEYYVNKRNSQVFMRKYPDGTKIVNATERYRFRQPVTEDKNTFYYVSYTKGGYCRVIDHENKEQLKPTIAFFDDYKLHNNDTTYARIEEINAELFNPNIQGVKRTLLFLELNELEDEYQNKFGKVYDLVDTLADQYNYLYYLLYPESESSLVSPQNAGKVIEEARQGLKRTTNIFHMFHRK